jgi:hypothetical protein
MARRRDPSNIYGGAGTMKPKAKKLLTSLDAFAHPPGGDVSAWLSSAEEGVEFLKQHTQASTTILYASVGSVLIHAVLAPLENLDPPDQEDLSHDFITPDASWMIEHVSGGGETDRVYLAPPMDRHGKTLRNGEKLVFRRSFVASPENSTEISQKLVHTLDLHFIEERNAYCRLNEDGDIENVITVTEIPGSDWHRGVVVTILTKDFAEYMQLGGMGMVVFFDFTRTRRGSFSGWSNVTPINFSARDLFYHGGVMTGHGSYVNGRMIVRPAITYEEIVASRVAGRRGTAREYATFKAINLKTQEPIEVSCSPEALSNYFQKDSPLPLEMSPAFFNAEVLHRYKADPDKYELRDRSIYCRGTWELRALDINDEGQIHTYLRYLRDLPYKEQVYWHSFNEWPKGGLSERAITTDFKGEFYTEYDSLNYLKQKIRSLDEKPPDWWIPRGEALAKAVHYPATASAAEWANEILALDQLLIEGFREKALRTLVIMLGHEPQRDWKSLRLLEECLAAKGVDPVDARAACSSLRKLRDMRNVTKGHAASTKRKQLEKEAITQHSSFRAHFAAVAQDCDAAMELVLLNLT